MGKNIKLYHVVEVKDRQETFSEENTKNQSIYVCTYEVRIKILYNYEM